MKNKHSKAENTSIPNSYKTVRIVFYTEKVVEGFML